MHLSLTGLHQILKAFHYETPPLKPTDVLIRHELSSLSLCISKLDVSFLLNLLPDPADLNVIEGRYNVKAPNRPDLVPGKETFVCGSEGMGYVEEVGSAVEEYKPGQQVLMRTRQMGTWQSRQVLDQKHVAAAPEGLSNAEACTLSSNPTTALRMIQDFVQLEPGEYLIQNGSNSTVGQAVIQLARALGFKTINLVRERRDEKATQELKDYLTSLGADHVVTHAEAHKPEFRKWVRNDLGGGKGIRLGLNCVSGPDTIPMLNTLADSGHVVTYGALSKKPLSFQNGWFIFQNGTAHGYNQGRWEANNSKEARQAMFEQLGAFIRNKQLRAPQHRIIDLSALEGDALLKKVLQAVDEQYGGFVNQKTLFKFI